MQKLLAILAEKQVRIELRDGRLHVHAAPGAITQELQQALGEHKDALIRYLENRSAPIVDEAYPVVVPDPARAHEPFPLNPVQYAYWFGRNDNLALGGTSTHVYMEFACGDVDPARLCDAFRKVIDRHGMLRAVVDADGRQRVLQEVPPYDIVVHDLSGLDEAAATDAFAEIRRALSEDVIPCERWPLYVIRLVNLPGGDRRLCMGWDFLTVDAWSMMIILREWARFHADPTFRPEPLALGFRDYVLAEIEYREGPSHERARRYWMARIDALPGPPQLPPSKRPPGRRDALRRRSIRMREEQWAALRARSRAFGITPSNLLLTAFSEVLGHWSAAPRFCVNLTLFNRLPMHPEVSAIVGDFTTLMLVEIDASEGGAFRERAARVQAQCLRDMEHRQFGAVEVIREINRSRGATLEASFPIVFTSTLMLDGSRGESSDAFAAFGPMVYGISQTPQVSLDCQIFEIGGELLVNWDAADALFQPGVIEDMFEAFARLLAALAAEPVIWEREAVVALPAEQLARRAQANATHASTPAICLHTPFVENALRDPRRIAVECGARSLSYGSLLANAASLSARLVVAGAEPGRLVAICGDRGPEQIVAVMAVLLSGAAYLPVDARWPALRRREILIEGAAGIVLALPGFPGEDALPEGVMRIDVEIDTHLPSPVAAPTPRQAPTDLAYVIFTSGSTGQPKGVMIAHDAAVNTVFHINRLHAVDDRDKVLAVSDLGFDLSVYDIFGTLAAGAAIVIPEAALGRDAGHWHTLIRRASVTVWNSAPQLMNMLVDYAHSVADGAMPSLRLTLLSGDWIPVTLPDRLRAVADGVAVVSLGGATECAIWSIRFPIDAVDPEWASIPYGRPLPNQSFHVLDAALRPLPDWVVGDLYIGGAGLARGYWRDQEKTDRSFIVDPATGERLYRTGDKGRYRDDGVIEFLGREDMQVKIRGYRVELGEISAILASHADVREAAVRRVADDHGSRLVGYVVPERAGGADEAALRDFLAERLPEYMVPARILALDGLPLSANGKLALDRLPVPQDDIGPERTSIVLPRSETERRVWSVWCRVLGNELVHVRENFFEAGGDSLRLMEVMNELNAGFDRPLSINELLQYPTIEALAEYLDGAIAAQAVVARSEPAPVADGVPHGDDVAIIGMAGRFPDAESVDALWSNLAAGHCAVRHFDDRTLREAGVDPGELAAPNYVKAGPVLPDIDRFDAAYFDLTPAEAAIMDPQQRLLLECAATALEDAGYADERGGERIGVFAGKGTNFYLYEHLIGNRDVARSADLIGILSLNEPDYAATLVSYKLGLTGPSLGINTACSTSLVAVHEACRSLTRSRDCEIAIAGGVTLSSTVSPSGYAYFAGHITSPDGYCRAFADDANGCVFGSGVGMVVLKPLKRAIEDRDTIHAVIRGTAINNDGALKLGFTAPSAQGQARVIADALAQADCAPDSIQSIEAHGTGTALGDPIEFQGLRAVFGGPRPSGERCALGSIKTNIGHLGSASGIAGLIKMVQSLRHRQIPPSLHAAVPSAKIDFAGSPFYVNGELREWPAPTNAPRRGGVSSFGVGGTNAHVVVEEAPSTAHVPVDARPELLLVSARSREACRQSADNLAAALSRAPRSRLVDVAYTLQLGRRAHEWRSAIVCEETEAAARALSAPTLSMRECARRRTPQVVYVSTGEGLDAPAIRRLYEDEPVFAAAFDRCADVLKNIAAYDLRARLVESSIPNRNDPDVRRAAHGLRFASEYALAQLWTTLGIAPAAVLASGVGECVAACIAGVFPLETALGLIDAQARLLQPEGEWRRCRVDAAEARVRSAIDGTACRIATIRGPLHCVVCGPAAAIDALCERLEALGIAHGSAEDADCAIAASDAGLAAYAEVLSDVVLRPPAIPLVLSAEDAHQRSSTDRRYWERQPSMLARFDAARRKIERIDGAIPLSLGAIDASEADGAVPISGLTAGCSGRAAMLETLGGLWMSGVDIDWRPLHAGASPRRVRLPTYPFQRTRHWIPRSATNRIGTATIPSAVPPVETAPAETIGVATSQRDPASSGRERIQTEILSIWEDVLGATDIGPDDNFFDLGGNSLMATRVFARVKNEFGFELPLNRMFEYATVRQMSLFVAVKADPEMLDRLSPEELKEMLAMTED
ncbi:MAG: amino acid adenylation domain-containing protein [Pseudomonadota bacterium]